MVATARHHIKGCWGRQEDAEWQVAEVQGKPADLT